MNEVEPHPFSAPLTVCVDFKSPHAYLAKDLVYALEDELGQQAEWLPYLVAPLRSPTAPRSADDRGTRHRRHRARYVEHDIQRYARVRGLVIDDIYRPVDASLAALALLWLRSASSPLRRAVIDALFAGHWESRMDIADPAAMAALLEGSGADVRDWEAYRAGRGPGELDRLQSALAAAGIFNVPAFVVPAAGADAEIFYGRAHLPMVRWLLQGRRGLPPI